MSANITVKSPLPAILSKIRALRPYVNVFIFLLFAAVYGFIVWQINLLSNPTIDEGQILSEAKTSAGPRIDEETIKQLQTLNDNSVQVQTLFQQGRSNPFQE